MAMKAVSTDRKNFISYPTNRVVGTVGDPARARAAIEALLRAGFNREHIDLLHGEEDLQRLDPTGSEHGFLAQFQRTLIRTLDLEEFKHLTHHVEDVRAGRSVIMVLTKRRALRIAAADILHQHGAEFVEFYGRWSYEDVPPTAHPLPGDIPALFARAWNDRNPDALAALFDEDAEFVDVSGRCWHDRESIRKAHRDRLGHDLNKSTLVAGDTKVKLLSPEVAVVHARLTRSGEEPGAVTPPGPRTTIVSFVVHRVGDGWRCASAHHTDVIPNAIDEAVSGLPNSPGGQPS
jgi:uncharacterized protein (TIGR02246 family)